MSSGTLIGGSVAVLAGTLWAAAAFSSHNSAFYDHLAWWYGGTLIGVGVVSALIAGILSTTRGTSAGVANGLSSWAIITLAAAAVVAVTAVAHGTTSTLTANGTRITVDLVRPYVAFWTAAFSLAAASLGGAGGGLLPRRRVSTTVVELLLATDTSSASTTNSRNVARAAG